MSKHNQNNKALLHFREPLILSNLILAMKESLPELEAAFNEYQDDLLQTGEYDQGYFSYIFNPYLQEFLQSKQKHPNQLGKRIFHYLERMARSPEWTVVNVLAVVILEHLSPHQLEVARQYMGPKTKEILKDIQQYWRDLHAAQK
ncbi:MAG: hypothetical protein AB7F19_00765 [Candidatus Babeliales bacterium]